MWLDVDDVVDSALDDLFAGRTVSIPTRRWKLVATVVDVLPRRLVSRVWNAMPSGAKRRHPGRRLNPAARTRRVVQEVT